MYEYYEKARNAAGLKDYDVCKLTGISAGTLSDWKRGRIKALKADKLAKIAEILDVTIEYLMTGEEEEKESVTGKKYYFNDETAEIAEEVFSDPDLRLLFDASRNAKPEVIRLAAEMLRQMKETNPDG